MKQTFRVALTISFFVFLPFLNQAIIGQMPSGDKDLAKILFDKIKDSRKKVKNFKCRVVYHDYRTKKAKQRQIENLKKKFQGKLSETHLKQLTRRLNDFEEYTFQKHKLAFDNEGRARVEMVFGISNSKGSLTDVQSKRISTWDGENSITYSDRFGSGSAVLSHKQPSETAKGHRQPWHTFGGIFYDYFSKAISDGSQIDVKIEEDETYRVELFYAKGRKRVGVIDPSKGFSVVLHESYGDGQLVARYKAKFTEASPNVWFPTEGEVAAFNTDTKPLLMSKETIKVSEIIINDPNFYDGLFHVDFPEGTFVRDAITGYQYVVGEPMSERPDGPSNEKSLHEVAMDTLEEMAKETNQKHQEVELFVPKVSLALEEGGPFVLGLSDGKLINSQNAPESQESNKFLTELGKGDIAWDGTVVATRGAKVLTIQQEAKRPLKLTKGKWTGSYKLPDKVELPYYILVVTKEDTNYLMTVRKIEPGGIKVTYRKLNPDELSRYKQKPKDS